MTITKEDELDGLREIGRIVANTMQGIAKAMQPGMTTRELDEIGRAFTATPAQRSCSTSTPSLRRTGGQSW